MIHRTGPGCEAGGARSPWPRQEPVREGVPVEHGVDARRTGRAGSEGGGSGGRLAAPSAPASGAVQPGGQDGPAGGRRAARARPRRGAYRHRGSRRRGRPARYGPVTGRAGRGTPGGHGRAAGQGPVRGGVRLRGRRRRLPGRPVPRLARLRTRLSHGDGARRGGGAHRGPGPTPRHRALRLPARRGGSAGDRGGRGTGHGRGGRLRRPGADDGVRAARDALSEGARGVPDRQSVRRFRARPHRRHREADARFHALGGRRSDAAWWGRS